jgi:hypothetical protein
MKRVNEQKDRLARDLMFWEMAISRNRRDWFSRFIRYEDVAYYASNNGLEMRKIIEGNHLQIVVIARRKFVTKKSVLQLLLSSKPSQN